MLRRLWELTEFPFHPEKMLHHETLYTIGNGYLSTRGAFEEGHTGAMPSTLVHGIFNHAPDRLVPELVNAPDWLPIRIKIDGTPFALNTRTTDYQRPPKGLLLGYRRTLHLDRGLLRRECLFRARSGAIVRIVFERFASLANQHILAQRVQIFAVDGSPEIAVEASLNGDVDNAGARHWTQMAASAEGPVVALNAVTGQSGYRLAMASTLLGPSDVSAQARSVTPSLTTRFKLATQKAATFDKLTAVYTSRDASDPLAEAFRAVREAAGAGYDWLCEAHMTAWAKAWRDCDIQIDGDEDMQFAVRFAMYHILIAAPRNDDRVSVGAKTLSGFGYKGHVFWDTELFILPPLTLTQPDIARNLLMYRYHNLPGARAKARANGFQGAMYPWESTDTGEETTPQWGDPMPDSTRIRIWTGDSEQHISTDIAYAVLQYWRWTGDDDFLRRYGAEIILDTAVFWASRVEAKDGRYELSQQIGPDEYHENIDNSVFTNRMVVWHLERALDVLEWLRRHAPDDARRLVGALGIGDALLERWRDIVARMFIPFDAEKQIHVQFPGFFDMEYIPVPLYEPRTHSVQAILGHQRAIQSQVIKQADVIMLMALLGDELRASPEVLLNNWNTYYPRTDHGSSLSPAIHARVAARMDMGELAYELFAHAAEIDLNDNKGNVRDGIHGAACGGLIQALLFGFCGLHLTPDGPALDPHLPDHWKGVSFSVCYRGQRKHFDLRGPGVGTPKA